MDMLGQSAVLTVLGIAVVFGFLAIMVLCVSAMGKFFQAREAASGLAEAKLAFQPGATPSSQPGISEGNPGTIAAISAALNEYRKNNNF